MTTLPQTVVSPVQFRKRHSTRHQQQPVSQAEPAREVPLGRVPRVARLMALALRFEQLMRAEGIAAYAELARLGQVSRARITQIMNLRMLAPDIQEALLFLPRTVQGRDPIHLRQLQPLAAALDWRQQRVLWQALRGRSAKTPSNGRDCEVLRD
jgi:hypothetical protein